MDGPEVLQSLWNDHRVSARLLDVFERVLPAACSADPRALRVALAVAAREGEYGDRVHHAREELLFSRLASRGAGGVEAVTGLTHDHNELVRMGTVLRELLVEHAAGREHDGEALRERAVEWADALRDHMRKEEQRVFARAPGHLTELDWAIVGEAFAGRVDPLAALAEEPSGELEAWLAEQGAARFESLRGGR